MTTQNNSLKFRDFCQFLQNGLLHICKNSPHIIQKMFQPLFRIQLTTSLFRHFLVKRPHIVKREGSGMDSLGLYLKPVMIRLNPLPVNFSIDRDVIQSDDFTQFLFELTKPPPRQFLDDCEVI